MGTLLVAMDRRGDKTLNGTPGRKLLKMAGFALEGVAGCCSRHRNCRATGRGAARPAGPQQTARQGDGADIGREDGIRAAT